MGTILKISVYTRMHFLHNNLAIKQQICQSLFLNNQTKFLPVTESPFVKCDEVTASNNKQQLKVISEVFVTCFGSTEKCKLSSTR